MFNPYIDARLTVIESELFDLKVRVKHMNEAAKEDAENAIRFWDTILTIAQDIREEYS